jgi:hypothetical protein
VTALAIPLQDGQDVLVERHLGAGVGGAQHSRRESQKNEYNTHLDSPLEAVDRRCGQPHQSRIRPANYMVKEPAIYRPRGLQLQAWERAKS